MGKRKKNQRKGWLGIGVKLLLVIVGVAFLTLFLFYFTVRVGLFGKMPNDDALTKIENSVATEVYSADSVLLGRFYLQERTRTRYEDISGHVIDALIATEDARFYEHDGVDYKGLMRVLFKTILLDDASAGGGSTITQQLVKNLFPRKSYGFLTMPVNKMREAIIAQKLEKQYSKAEIITLYLNTVPFGDNLYGLEMASRTFFGKKNKALTVPEAAVLIGMLKANYYYNPRINPENSLSRRNVVMYQMVKYGYLNESLYDEVKKEPLALKYRKITQNTGIATYFREYLRQELEVWCEKHEKGDNTPYNLYTDGLKIYTTIDSRLQHHAEQAMKTHMKRLQATFDSHWQYGQALGSDEVLQRAVEQSARYKNLKKTGLKHAEIMVEMKKPVMMKVFNWQGDKEVKLSPIDSVKHYLTLLQTGVLALDSETGDIKVWVGGINHEYFKYDHVNINTKRQVGSTFKPFVYAAALEAGLDPCSYIPAKKTTYANMEGWSPGNADTTKYNNKYTFEGALTHSVNTVTIRLLESVGISHTIDFARRVGISSDLPEVPSIALGTADISLMEMVTAYATFSNGGYAVTPRYITTITDHRGEVLETFKNTPPKRVIKAETAMMINAMLQSVVNEGTGGRYRWKYHMTNELAGKTGTTQSNTDGWFIGYNSRLVTGVWVGADNPAVRFRTTALGSGANTALPIVAGFFNEIHKDKAVADIGFARFPELPERVRRKLDCDPVKEDKGFMEWLFGKKETPRERDFGEKKEKNGLFDKIGKLLKGG